MSDIDQLIALHLPAARRGDRQAFAALVAATQTTVTSVALAVVRDIQYSEDVAQEAYLRVWQRLHHLKDVNSFLPWLRQITRNLARDHLRRRMVRPGDTGTGSSSEIERDVARTGSDSTEDSLLLAEQDQIIRQALDALPAESREVLALYYREGQSSRHVARLLGISDAAVRKRLERSRSCLRSEVANRLGTALLSTAPGMAFTAAVGAMLVAASPPAAAAVSLSFGAKGAAKLVGAASIGALLGLIGGLAGVILGLRRWIRTSTDPVELQGLLRIRRLGVVTVVLAVIGLTVSGFVPGWWPATAVFVLFLAAIGWQQMVMLPRALSGRLAREREIDPAAAGRQLRQRRLAWLGMISGGLMGGAGLIAGLISAGRIGLGG